MHYIATLEYETDIDHIVLDADGVDEARAYVVNRIEEDVAGGMTRPNKISVVRASNAKAYECIVGGARDWSSIL